MDEQTQDDLFLAALNAIVLDALAAIGGDPEARFRLIRQLLIVANEAAEGRDLGPRYDAGTHSGLGVTRGNSS